MGYRFSQIAALLLVAGGLTIGDARLARARAGGGDTALTTAPLNALPDLRITRGSRDIAQVWLGDPTKRYKHFVLGADYEAASLFVRAAGSREIIKLTLPQSSVFEDREPRLADLDGDGRDEIVLVQSFLTGGAALAVYGLRNGALSKIAQTPDMGHPFGWLNPAGIADFDGDGRKEILFVRKPHVLGRLEMWRLQAGKLRRIMSVSDTSNHIVGTKQIRLWAIADFDGDGVSDLAIPSFDRRAVRFLGFKGGRMREIARKILPARAKAQGDFKLLRVPGGPAVRVGLTNGGYVIVGP